MILRWQTDTCLAKGEAKISKHDDNNKAIIVKRPSSENVIYKHGKNTENLNDSVVHKNGDKYHLLTIQREGIAGR